MTVKMLKEILQNYNDDDRIILDRGDTFRAGDNEVLLAFKHKKSTDQDYPPVVVLQTRDDIDVSAEIIGIVDYYTKVEHRNSIEIESILDDIGFKKSEYFRIMDALS